MSAFDLNIILDNLLNNSIEALAKSEKNDSAFNLQIEYAQGILKISIKNSYDGKVYQQNDSFKIIKKDTNLHGIGIEGETTFKVKILLCEDDFKS